MATWIQKRKAAVLLAWRRNEISLRDAAAALVDLGFSAEQAWSILERT